MNHFYTLHQTLFSRWGASSPTSPRMSALSRRTLSAGAVGEGRSYGVMLAETLGLTFGPVGGEPTEAGWWSPPPPTRADPCPVLEG